MMRSFATSGALSHNGETSFAPAIAALQRARAEGVTIILVTNSPRPHPGVVAQMSLLGVPEDAYDRVVTSGDVTRDLIAEGRAPDFPTSAAGASLPFMMGLTWSWSRNLRRQAWFVPGFMTMKSETPEDYRELLQRLRARNLPFICANPDIMVERGPRLIWCAGSACTRIRPAWRAHPDCRQAPSPDL